MSAARVNGVPLERLNTPEAKDRMVLSIMGHNRVTLKALDPEKQVRVWKCDDCGEEVRLDAD